MFWQVIAANKRNTVILVVAMGVVLALVGFCAGSLVGAWLGMTAYGLEPAPGGPNAGWVGMVIALLVWFVLLLAALLGSDELFLGLAGAKEISHDTYPQLFNVVEEMKIASSLPTMPRVFIVDDPAPNAFALGKSPKKCAVCVTAGLLAMCDRDELQGVIAHEIGHIVNRDALYLGVAATMLGAVTIISDTLLRSLRYAPVARYRSPGTRGGKGMLNVWFILLAFVFIIVSPILSSILYFSISRRREYLADATSARLTRYPPGLASALEKIMLSPAVLTTAPRVIAPFYTVNPYKQDLEGGLFATHPPLPQRIRILRAMAGGASFRDYVKAYWDVTRTRKQLIPVADMRLGETVEIRAPSPMTPEQGRTGDIIRAMNDFVFIPCPCGMTMKIPPEFARGVVQCPRCGRDHTVKGPDKGSAAAILAGASAFTKQASGREQAERRVKGAWQTVTCLGCGKGITLSSAFSLGTVTCTRCGQVIRLT
ncbi:MAG TPA: M48 family metalloprotease [Deltaproteobacteria bacterium]|nr:M48 family metalloprotease [Deltaproteobacteria bacterium]HOM29510.1 M48 family metalloprotease [Deltaproteobacteria bacterium]HPP81427.1 M48 family metalloprotease [Deltaproteobacteria bacterium]